MAKKQTQEGERMGYLTTHGVRADVHNYMRTTGIAVCLLVALMIPEKMRAADYKLVLEKSFHPGEAAVQPRARSLTRTGDGDFLLLVQSLWSSFGIKVKADGTPSQGFVVEGLPGSNQEGFAIVPARDGVLLLGRTNSTDLVPSRPEVDGTSRATRARGVTNAALAVRLNRDGRVVWRKVYGKLEKFNDSAFACGAHVEDGFVVVGRRTKLWSNQPTQTGTFTTSELWVVKLNEQGDTMWETAVSLDGDELVDTMLLRQSTCSRPVVDAQGNAALAISVNGRTTIEQDGQRIVYGPGLHGSKNFVLILALDSRGKERARFRLDDGGIPRLFRLSTGYVVLDNLLLSDGGKRGIRQTFLDLDLKPILQRLVRGKGFYLDMEDASMDPAGGIHIAGYYVVPPKTSGKTAIGYLGTSGEILTVKTLGSGLPSWNPVALSAGGNTNEVFLLQDNGEDNDVKLVKFLFSN